MSYDSCRRILKSKLYALVVALVALGAPAIYAQENGTPGAGGPNFAIYPRLLSSPNAWSSIQREPPCFPVNTSGTITLTLNDCSTPANVRRGGSPAYWHVNLSGNGTLAVTGLATGYVFRVDIVANGFTLALPSGFVLPSFNPVVSGNSFIVCEVHDISTIWCPGGIQAGLVTTSSLFTFTNANSCVSANGPTCTISSTNMISADLLVVCLSWQTFTGDISGIPTDSSSNTYTLITLVNNTNQSTKTACYYKQAPVVTGVMTFTASFTGNTFPYIAAIGFSGSVATPLDQTNSFNSGATGNLLAAQPGSITPTQNNELVVAFLGIDAGSASSGNAIDSGYTLKNSQNFVPGSNLGGAMGYLIQTTAAATNPTFSWTAQNAVQAMIMSFKP